MFLPPFYTLLHSVYSLYTLIHSVCKEQHCFSDHSIPCCIQYTLLHSVCKEQLKNMDLTPFQLCFSHHSIPCCIQYARNSIVSPTITLLHSVYLASLSMQGTAEKYRQGTFSAVFLPPFYALLHSV